MALVFKQVTTADIPHDILNGYADRNIHQTREWVAFLEQTQNADSLYAALLDGSELLGYFTGLITEKFGFRILGSPFPGWSTTYMGFNLRAPIEIAAVLSALETFCFKILDCDHLELLDRRITEDVAKDLGYSVWSYRSFEIDLRHSETEIFRGMRHSCRNCVRKAERSGVEVVEAHDSAFAQDYHNQISHVFETKGLPPPFGRERVKALIDNLQETGNLLLLRAMDKSGRCIATGIFPAMNQTAYAWGSASWRAYSNSRPNEAIFWYAMKYWKNQGMLTFDLVGAAEYKKKYGGVPTHTPWIRKSKNRRTAFLRTAAETILLRYPRLGTLINGAV